MFMAVERPKDPAHDAIVLDCYERLLRERWQLIADLRQQLPASTELDDAVRAFGAARTADPGRAYLAFETIVTIANRIEQQAGPVEERSGPRALDPSQTKEILDLARTEFEETRKLLARMAVDQVWVPVVFGANQVADAHSGFTAIAEQLTAYEANDHVQVDATGLLNAGSTILRNNGNAGLDKAVMILTRGWADRTPERRQSALVHEASHGSALGTRDHAYISTWAFDGLSDQDKLHNAPHYEAVAELVLGVRDSVRLALDTELADADARQLLGRTSLGLTEIQLRGSRFQHQLQEWHDQKPEGDTTQLREVAGQLGLPLGQSASPLNIDLELFGLFRTWLHAVHSTLSGITTLRVAPERQIQLSDDHTTLTVDADVAQARPEDIRRLTVRLVLSTPAPVKWEARQLLTAMGA